MRQSRTLINSNRHVNTAKTQISFEINALNSQKRKSQAKATKIVLPIILLGTKLTQTLTLTTAKKLILPIIAIQITEITESRELSTYPMRLVTEITTPQRNASLEPMHQTDRLLGTENQWDRAKENENPQKTMQMKVSSLRPE